ncbi:hypothetical protein ACS8E3_07820 [Psychrobacter sp. 2Y5]|uniref:hypothetical protein n=1 Tax=unclassified Psychrobacter TaxID=196806 RepID=UPI003F463F22
MPKDIYALTGHLHDQLDRISNPDMSAKQLEVELARGASITKIAAQVIDGERVINERARIIAEHAPNNLVDVLRVGVVKDD